MVKVPAPVLKWLWWPCVRNPTLILYLPVTLDTVTVITKACATQNYNTSLELLSNTKDFICLCLHLNVDKFLISHTCVHWSISTHTLHTFSLLPYTTHVKQVLVNNYRWAMRYLSKYTNVKLVPIDLNNLKIHVQSYCFP